jgi:Flp pilus assembly protein TadG
MHERTLKQDSSAAPRRARRSRGTSIIEFTLVLPLLLIMIVALIEFGHLIQARLIVANVAREGGSIASRTLTLDQPLVNLIAVSGHPLDLDGADGKIVITRVTAGTSAASPNPTVTTTVSTGGLAQGSVLAGGPAGLPANIYQHLVYKTGRPAPGVDGSDVSELTMVEVFYNYKPITPLPGFWPGMIAKTGQLLKSRAIY